MPQCNGITQDGTRCLNRVKYNRKYCYIHTSSAKLKRKETSRRPLFWYLTVIGLIVGLIANYTDILGFLQTDIPPFQRNGSLNQASNISISIGRDLLHSTIIRSGGNVTINENPTEKNLPSTDSSSTPINPEALPQTTIFPSDYENSLFLPAVIKQ